MNRLSRELSEYADLWNFLGRDGLGTRVTAALVGEGSVPLADGDRVDVNTVDGLQSAYADEWGRAELENIRLIGRTGLAHIAERCVYWNLRDFLGRDTLGTRTANALARAASEGGGRLRDYLGDGSWDVLTAEGLRATYADERGRFALSDTRFMGAAAMARIAERCS